LRKGLVMKRACVCAALFALLCQGAFSDELTLIWGWRIQGKLVSVRKDAIVFQFSIPQTPQMVKHGDSAKTPDGHWVLALFRPGKEGKHGKRLIAKAIPLHEVALVRSGDKILYENPQRAGKRKEAQDAATERTEKVKRLCALNKWNVCDHCGGKGCGACAMTGVSLRSVAKPKFTAAEAAELLGHDVESVRRLASELLAWNVLEEAPPWFWKAWCPEMAVIRKSSVLQSYWRPLIDRAIKSKGWNPTPGLIAAWEVDLLTKGRPEEIGRLMSICDIEKEQPGRILEASADSQHCGQVAIYFLRRAKLRKAKVLQEKLNR